MTVDAISCNIVVTGRQNAELVAQTIGRFADRIKALPSVQPERWIPVSEKLPEVREWVLCQCRAGIMDVLRLTEDGDWNKNYPHAGYMSGFVIAWMPLPEPYRGGEKE